MTTAVASNHAPESERGAPPVDLPARATVNRILTSVYRAIALTARSPRNVTLIIEDSNERGARRDYFRPMAHRFEYAIVSRVAASDAGFFVRGRERVCINGCFGHCRDEADAVALFMCSITTGAVVVTSPSGAEFDVSAAIKDERPRLTSFLSDAHLEREVAYCDEKIGRCPRLIRKQAGERADAAIEILRRRRRSDDDFTALARQTVCTPSLDAPIALEVLSDRLAELGLIPASNTATSLPLHAERYQRTFAYALAYAHTTTREYARAQSSFPKAAPRM